MTQVIVMSEVTSVSAPRGGLMLGGRCCFAASRVIQERHRQLATCSALRTGAEESSGRVTLAFPIPLISSRQLGVSGTAVASTAWPRSAKPSIPTQIPSSVHLAVPRRSPTSNAKRANGLTDADIDAELEAWRKERKL
jgi:hypothetical protein